MRNLLLIGLLCLTTSGCSVAMALHGKEDANLGALEIGQNRDIVILNLGQPSKTVADEGGRVDFFELSQGNAPSAGRALGHGAMDLITLGWWEILGTPVEAMSSGKKIRLQVEYDDNDTVKNIKTGVAKEAF